MKSTAMPSEISYDVAVVGAGYAGLMTALAVSVRTAGALRIVLIDKRPWAEHPKVDARASALSAATINLLEKLDVWSRLKPHACPVEEIALTDPIGDSPLRQVLLRYENTVDDGPASWIVENTHLMTALRTRVERDGAIDVLTGNGIEAVTAASANAHITFGDGRTLATPLVLACDGARSPLRASAGIPVVGWDYPQAGIVTTIAHDRPHHGIATQHFFSGGPFAMLPLPDRRTSIVWSEQKERAAEVMAMDDAAFVAAVSDRVGTSLGTISLDGPRASWPLRLQLARRLTAPRLALIGDAARSVHPLAGQGLNLAARDVAAVADTVFDACALGLDHGAADTLETYERSRRFDGGSATLMFDAINRIFSNGLPLLRSLRDAGLELVDRTPQLKSFFVAEAAGISGEDL
ncbi:MAG: FAD-dependent monooxygenase, partial [Pseudomonadota bacterium]